YLNGPFASVGVTAPAASSNISTVHVTAGPTTALSTAPITVVVTSVYTLSITTNSAGLPTSGTSTTAFVQISTLSSLPLTTIFTPPTSCSTRPFTLSTSNNILVGIWNYSSNSVDLCYPPDWATAKTNYYTPGVCPKGHTYAGIDVGSESLDVRYTPVNCCPSGMDLVGTQYRTLVTTTTYALLPDLRTGTITNFPLSGFATPLRVVWNWDNLSKFTPNAAPVVAYANRDKPLSSGLSVGAKAGIGIGVALGVLLLVEVVIFAMFRVRKREAGQFTPASPDEGDVKPEPAAVMALERKTMAEFDDQGESREMEGDAMFPELAHLIKSSELEVPHKVHELPG
ncbi:unnamed protein product, partial [Aureobasidium vineae]